MKYCALFLIGCFSLLSAQNQDFRILNISDMHQEMTKEFFHCPSGNTIVIIPEDEVVSLEFFMQGSVFALEGCSDLRLRVLQTFFIKPHCEDILFSLDGETWQTFTEFFTGNMMAAVVPNVNCSELKVELGSELHMRMKQ